MKQQPKITHIPRSALAMVGIVTAIVQIAITLPLHIASLLGVEVNLIVAVFYVFGFVIQILLSLPIWSILNNWAGQPRKYSAELRKQYGWPRWIWSPSYWNAQLPAIAPYAPGWLRWVGIAILPYAMIMFFISFYMLIMAYNSDRSMTTSNLLTMTTSALFWSIHYLPMLVSMWRESQLQSGEPAPSRVDHAS